MVEDYTGTGLIYLYLGATYLHISAAKAVGDFPRLFHHRVWRQTIWHQLAASPKRRVC